MLTSLLLCAFLSSFVHALRADCASTACSPLSFQTRDTGSGIPLNNIADLSYYVQITLGGQAFSVLVDTGSSDLWVAGSVVASEDTGIDSSISYAAGNVNGSIKTGTLEFAGYTILNQVFLEVKPNAVNKIGSGIIGLGPTTGSFLYLDLQSLAGEAVLNHIFMQNLTTPNYFTILLGREHDIEPNPSGSLTIGEILNGYTEIEYEQSLIMTGLSNHAGDHHIQVLLDEDGIISPNGQRIPLTTEVSGTINKKQATVLIDCGFSLPQVPQSVSDAIYSLYYGAEFINIPSLGATWIVPCDQEINMTLIFGRTPYPIHPLDMTIEPGVFGLDNIVNSEGKNSCIGTFQPFTYRRSNPISYDMILGMAFMRNVYVLFDYGNLVASSTKPSDPFIKMLSVTNVSNAHLSFVNVRLGGIDTTGSQRLRGINTRQANRKSLYVIIAASTGLLVVAVMGFMVFNLKRHSPTSG